MALEIHGVEWRSPGAHEVKRPAATVDVVIQGSILMAGGQQTHQKTIEGHGLFASRPLREMHAHIDSRDQLMSYLRYGVASVRNMAGTPTHLALARAKSPIYPEFATTSPIVDGRSRKGGPAWSWSRVVTGHEEARMCAESLIEQGYRALKVYDNLVVRAHRTICEVAAERGVLVTGHCPASMDWFEAVENGQGEFEHLTRLTRFEALVGSEALWRSEASRLQDIGQMLAERRVTVTPTVTALHALALKNGAPTVYFERMRELVAELHAVGVRLQPGTDMPVGGRPGLAIWSETKNLNLAGIPPWRTWEIATSAASFPDDSDVPSVGSAGDLIILDVDPYVVTPSPANLLYVVRGGVIKESRAAPMPADRGYDLATRDAIAWSASHAGARIGIGNSRVRLMGEQWEVIESARFGDSQHTTDAILDPRMGVISARVLISWLGELTRIAVTRSDQGTWRVTVRHPDASSQSFRGEGGLLLDPALCVIGAALTDDLSSPASCFVMEPFPVASDATYAGTSGSEARAIYVEGLGARWLVDVGIGSPTTIMAAKGALESIEVRPA